MHWEEIRKLYPDQWLIIEALEAYTSPDHQRHLDQLVFIESCVDANIALTRYRSLHQENPQREFYFVHTSRVDLDIREQQWLGVRSNNAFAIKG